MSERGSESMREEGNREEAEAELVFTKEKRSTTRESKEGRGQRTNVCSRRSCRISDDETNYETQGMES